ncbi:MAG: pyrroline-5-carboxylate reductase [Gammaproteobacteria bacterium]|nr:pyrroline-5-carboxylate reductase [Gammaproteobacteria bacterium]
MDTRKIGFIGAGNMARSLAKGLIDNGWPTARLILSDPNDDQRTSTASLLGTTCIADNSELISHCDVLVLAVKPQLLKSVLQPLASAVQQRKPLVISVVAGILVEDIQSWLGGGLNMVRTMPNTPALIGSGATGLYASPGTSADDRNFAESLMRACGVTVWVDSEAKLDVITALSGSGPAYFFLMIEALENAAVARGLDSNDARLLAVETALGAAKMALESDEDPAQLRRRVTSPGGTTEQAINTFEEAGLRDICQRAIDAAIGRARELAQMFGGNDK